ncbi:MAG: NnrS family protein [Deltaproteobacteria bacterium]|nr:NnrS family protein [Deltaproteobacteria bacterium]
MEDKKIEPYSLFFSMGLLSALFGSLLWFAFQTRFISFFPRQAHGNIMFFGFLWSYIAGFLMTAIPKMTRTAATNYVEIFIGLLLVVLQWVLNVRNELVFSVYGYILQILFLIVFIGRRFLDKKQIPFEGFVFMPFAFISTFIGVWIFIRSQNQDFQLFYLFSGQAFVLNLVCGLGTRLIPVITRVPAAINPDIEGQKSKYLEYFILAVSLNAGFWIEVLVDASFGNAIKALVIGFIAIKYFKLFKVPTTRSFVGWGIRLAVVLMTTGFIGLGVNSDFSLPMLHLVYIGGFTLITLMISTRVTLAHGPQDMTPELNSNAILVTVVFFALAGFSRVFAGQSLDAAILSFSILFFILAIAAWSVRFVKDLLKL